MKILAIGAHPDDIEVGCAGNLLKYAQAGCRHDIYLLVMSNGGRGGQEEVRRAEQERSAALMGAKDLIWGGYNDTELSPQMNRMVSDIEAMIRKIGPDFIFVNSGNDTHQDHRSLSKAAVSATRYVKNVLFYEVPTTVNFSPLVFVDIKETLPKKIDALLAHRSQVMKTNIEGLTIVDVATGAPAVRRSSSGGSP